MRIGLAPEVPLTGVNYKIKSGKLYVSGIPGEGKILEDGTLDSKALSMVAQASGRYIMIEITYSDPAGTTRTDMISFQIR
jgi:hypothetical protein